MALWIPLTYTLNPENFSLFFGEHTIEQFLTLVSDLLPVGTKQIKRNFIIVKTAVSLHKCYTLSEIFNRIWDNEAECLCVMEYGNVTEQMFMFD